MAYEKNPDEIGALWEKTGGKGPYMTGTIDGVKVVLFKNGNKASEKSPDWRVMKSKPKDVPDAGHNLNAAPVSDGDIPF